MKQSWNTTKKKIVSVDYSLEMKKYMDRHSDLDKELNRWLWLLRGGGGREDNLSNYPPTPPLTQQQSTDSKLGLMLG